MLDVPSGRVAYAVFRSAVPRLGEQALCRALECLDAREQEHEFILKVDKQVLENAPDFDEDLAGYAKVKKSVSNATRCGQRFESKNELQENSRLCTGASPQQGSLGETNTFRGRKRPERVQK